MSALYRKPLCVFLNDGHSDRPSLTSGLLLVIHPTGTILAGLGLLHVEPLAGPGQAGDLEAFVHGHLCDDRSRGTHHYDLAVHGAEHHLAMRRQGVMESQIGRNKKGALEVSVVYGIHLYNNFVKNYGRRTPKILKRPGRRRRRRGRREKNEKGKRYKGEEDKEVKKEKEESEKKKKRGGEEKEKKEGSN